MKTTHGSFTRSAGAPIHHHRGSCQGNIRRKYSFFFIFPPFHLDSCLGNFRGQSGYFLFHIFTPFFLLLICGHEILLNYFLSPFFSSYVYGWTENFFPSLHRASEKYYDFFVVSELFFSSYVSGWTEKEKIFPQSLHGVCGKYYENIFCHRISFLLLHLWMNRRRQIITTDFAQSVWEFKRF